MPKTNKKASHLPYIPGTYKDLLNTTKLTQGQRDGFIRAMAKELQCAYDIPSFEITDWTDDITDRVGIASGSMTLSSTKTVSS